MFKPYWTACLALGLASAGGARAADASAWTAWVDDVAGQARIAIQAPASSRWVRLPSPAAADDLHPSIAVSPSGALHVVFARREPGAASAVWHALLSATGEVIAMDAVAGASPGYTPDVAVSTTGDVLATWSRDGSDGAPEQIVVAKLDAHARDGGVAPRSLAYADRKLRAFPSIGFDAGRPVLAWMRADADGYRIEVARCGDSACAAAGDPQAIGTGIFPDLVAADASGNGARASASLRWREPAAAVAHDLAGRDLAAPWFPPDLEARASTSLDRRVATAAGGVGNEVRVSARATVPATSAALPAKLVKDRIMAFGDSVTWGEFDNCYPNDYPAHPAGYPLRLKPALDQYYKRSFDMQNLAVPGETSTDGASRFPATFNAVAPSYVMVMEGENNYFNNSSYTVWANDLGTMAGYATSHGAKFMLNDNTPVSDIQRLSQYDWMKGFNPPSKYYATIAAAAQVPHAKVWVPFTSVPGWDQNLISPSDGHYNHPNCAGYNQAALTIYNRFLSSGILQ